MSTTKKHEAPERTKANALHRAAALSNTRRGLDDRITAYVIAARLSGASWAEVGDALGVTRQAAQQRYGG